VVGAAQTWRTRSGRTLIVAGQLAGSSNLTLKGYGIVQLSAGNSFSGSPLVNGGTLKVANSVGSATGSGAVTVAGGGPLSGSGSLSGPLSLSGTLSPGNGGVGTLTSGTQTWNGGGLLNWEINSIL
jgi:fibronectin-binding autotransporter adhesin